MQPIGLGKSEIFKKWTEFTKLDNRQKIIDKVVKAVFIVCNLVAIASLSYLIARRVQNYSLAKTALHTLVPTGAVVATLFAIGFFTRNLGVQTDNAERELGDKVSAKIALLPQEGSDQDRINWIIVNVLDNERDPRYAETLLRRLTWGQNDAFYVKDVKNTLRYLYSERRNAVTKT